MILNWLFKKYNLINQDRMKEINYKQVKVFGAINKMINKYFILVFCLKNIKIIIKIIIIIFFFKYQYSSALTTNEYPER